MQKLDRYQQTDTIFSDEFRSPSPLITKYRPLERVKAQNVRNSISAQSVKMPRQDEPSLTNTSDKSTIPATENYEGLSKFCRELFPRVIALTRVKSHLKVSERRNLEISSPKKNRSSIPKVKHCLLRRRELQNPLPLSQ